MVLPTKLYYSILGHRLIIIYDQHLFWSTSSVYFVRSSGFKPTIMHDYSWLLMINAMLLSYSIHL
jgi:hypothetical protein